MENEQSKTESTEPKTGDVVQETQHAAHPHARRRVVIGVSAVVLILIAGLIIWPRWGERIKEACFGDGEVCTVELPDASE